MIILLWLPLALHANQDTIYHHTDTTSKVDEYQYYIDLTKKPDAIKATWLAAILPGAGQIYNKSYWKLPIVYGAFMGCGYAISINQNRYQSYRNAYLDLYKDNEAGTVTEDASKSYIAILPDGYDLARVGGKDTWLKTLKSNAYVDAQLFDYDISPDLSVNIEPQINFDEQRRQSTELKLAIRF